MVSRTPFRATLCALGLAVLPLGAAPAAPRQAPIIIGLDADMSRDHAQAGEAIRRGMYLAVDEINRAGGVLRRKMTVLVRDNAGRVQRENEIVALFQETDNLVAVMGAPHTPGPRPMLDRLYEHGMIYLDPWSDGETADDNIRFTFRISPGNLEAGRFIGRQAAARGYRKPALLIEDTNRGYVVEAGIMAALAEQGLKPAAVARFPLGTTDMGEPLGRFLDAGADIVLTIAGQPESLVLVRTMAALRPDQRRPIIAHWAVTAGDIFAAAGEALERVEYLFIQTFSFLSPRFPARANKVARAYCYRYGRCRSLREIRAPSAVAHAYDLVHLLARAIDDAETTDRAAVRDALEQLLPHAGLIGNYEPPFTRFRHHALTAEDFRLARFDSKGAIVFESRRGPIERRRIAERPSAAPRRP